MHQYSEILGIQKERKIIFNVINIIKIILQNCKKKFFCKINGLFHQGKLYKLFLFLYFFFKYYFSPNIFQFGVLIRHKNVNKDE